MLLGQSKIIFHYLLTAILLCVLLVCSWFLHYNFDNVGDNEQRAANRMEIMRAFDSILIDASDAETGVRGFLLSRNESFLEPYFGTKKSVWDNLAVIKQRTNLYGDSGIVEEIRQLEVTLTKHFEVLEALVDKYRNSSGHASHRELVVSRNIMDEARRNVKIMKDIQNARLQQRSVVLERSRLYFDVSLIGITALLSIMIILVSVRVAHNYAKIEADAEAQAQEAKAKAFSSDVSQCVSGNLTVKEAGLGVLRYFSAALAIPAGRLFLKENGHIKHYVDLGIKEGEEELTLIENDQENKVSLVRAAFEQFKIMEIQNIPAQYWVISSSLGGATPRCIYFLPVIFQKEVVGVFELGSFHELDSEKRSLLESVQEVLGIGLNTALSRERLQDLLEKTQLQSEELQAQQEELRTSNEELEQQAQALESQQESLNIKNQELQIAKQKLEAQTQELKNSNQYKSDFLARMSHELRTPLNGLLILSSLLIENKENNLTPRQLDFLLSIHNSGNDLLMIINDILDLSKIEARKLAIRPEPFTIKSIFDSKTRNFSMQASSKGLDFKVDLPEELSSLEIFTDRQRLEQILRNFLSNAIKFTEHGSVTLSAQRKGQEQVTFTVKDTGIGISSDKLEQVFHAFEQGDSSTSRKYGGTGLGLTISQELAHLLGGEITLDSKQGEGSSFSLTIPLKLDVSEEMSSVKKQIKIESPAQSKGSPESSFSEDSDLKSQALQIVKSLKGDKKTILVVEDDDKFRKSVMEIVRSYNFDPIEVADGELATALLKEFSPDAILLDVRLPGISGMGILEMVKRLPHLRHIPVHMISAYDYHHNALRMGALGYLTKPVTLENLHVALGRINHVLSRNIKKVLLVEDDSTQSFAISELISDKDIEVVTVQSGEKAVKEIQKGLFDCVILDLKLPDMSGFEILSQINSLDVLIPPIIVYTGQDLSEKEEEYLRKYSESIVIKGARSPERLLDEVNLFLHRMESILPEDKQRVLNHLRAVETVFEGKKILIADDDIRNVFALTSALENKGLEILVARNGVEAVETLTANPNIDLVLMDIMMPKMDGLEATQRIRASSIPELKEVPIIALTAKAMRGDHEKCMEAGASDYLPKPVNLENLMTVLKVWLTPKGF